jgi:hypothetical protein
MRNLTPLILLSALALSACAAPLRPTYMPDGRVGYAIQCSGQYLNWAACYQYAGDTCGTSGYEIVHASGDEARTSVSTPYASLGTPIITRSMVFACK